MPALSEGMTGSSSRPQRVNASQAPPTISNMTPVDHRKGERCVEHEQQGDHEQAEQDRRRDLETFGPVGTAQEISAEDLLRDLGMDRDPGHVLPEWRRADVEEACGGGADEDDVSVDALG